MMAEWYEVPLRDLVGYISKGIAPVYSEEKTQTTIRVLNQKCSRDFKISYDDSKLHETQKKKVPIERYVRPYDILINATGAGTAGRIAQIDEVPFATTIDGHMILIRTNGKVAQKFLGYALKAHQWEISQLDEGSTGQTELNRNRLLDEIMIRYPVSFDEQKQIVSILSALDEKIATNRAINENLEEQAQALVKEYCSSTDSEIALGSIMNFVNGFAFQSKSYQKNGKYRIVTIKNVQDGRIDTQGAAYIDEVPKKMKNECYLRVSDILLSLTGNVGRVGIVFENNLLLNQRVAKFTSSKDILPLLYFFFRLSETKVSLETIAKGTAQQNLSPIETLKLSFPYDEDKALILSRALKPMFDSIVNNSAESSKLAQLRDSLLPKLMSGEIDVSAVQL